MHVPSGWLMPFTMVVVHIQALTYDILGCIMVILAQIKVHRTLLTKHASDGEAGTPTSHNPSHVSLNDGWGHL